MADKYSTLATLSGLCLDRLLTLRISLSLATSTIACLISVSSCSFSSIPYCNIAKHLLQICKTNTIHKYNIYKGLSYCRNIVKYSPLSFLIFFGAYYVSVYFFRGQSSTPSSHQMCRKYLKISNL